MMLPVLTHHIRYHQCLKHLDDLIGYVFKERCLLQVRETHAHSQCSPIRAESSRALSISLSASSSTIGELS